MSRLLFDAFGCLQVSEARNLDRDVVEKDLTFAGFAVATIKNFFSFFFFMILFSLLLFPEFFILNSGFQLSNSL